MAREHGIEDRLPALELAELEVRLGGAHAPAVTRLRIGRVARELLERESGIGELAAEEQALGELLSACLGAQHDCTAIPVGGDAPRERCTRGIGSNGCPARRRHSLAGLLVVIRELLGWRALFAFAE